MCEVAQPSHRWSPGVTEHREALRAVKRGRQALPAPTGPVWPWSPQHEARMALQAQGHLGTSQDGSADPASLGVWPSRGGGAALGNHPTPAPPSRRAASAAVARAIQSVDTEWKTSILKGSPHKQGRKDSGEQVISEMALPSCFYGSDETWLSRRRVLTAGPCD